MAGVTTRAAILKMPVFDAQGLIQLGSVSPAVGMVTIRRLASDSAPPVLQVASRVKIPQQHVPVVTLRDFEKVIMKLRHLINGSYRSACELFTD